MSIEGETMTNIKTPEEITDYFPGKGCLCAAHGSIDCGCHDVDWTDKEVYVLRAEKESVDKRCKELEKVIADAYLDYKVKQANLNEKIKDAVEALKEITSAVGTLNFGNNHAVRLKDDDEPVYQQRHEWCVWILEIKARCEKVLMEIGDNK